jgi:hypothetical protein
MLVATVRGQMPELNRPIKHPQPRGRGVQFGLGAVLQCSNTPSLRAAGFEDEDDDEDENEAPGGFLPLISPSKADIFQALVKAVGLFEFGDSNRVGTVPTTLK